jgi:uncharacterized protein (DUF433 family)
MSPKDGTDTATGARSSLSRPPPARTSWISKTPGVCGGDACIRNTRITVWGLVERRNLGGADAEMLDDIPGLTRDDLAAAWEYFDQHREEIDQAIRENDEA